MTVTTDEAAEIAGVSPATVRSWVMKGWLLPVPVLDPTRRHHLFDVGRVVACERDHRPAAKRAAIKRAQDIWASQCEMLDNPVTFRSKGGSSCPR